MLYKTDLQHTTSRCCISKTKNIFWPYGNNRYITRHPFKINAIYPSRWLDHFTFIVRLYHDFTVFQCIFMYLKHLLRFVSFQVSQWFLPLFNHQLFNILWNYPISNRIIQRTFKRKKFTLSNIFASHVSFVLILFWRRDCRLHSPTKRLLSEIVNHARQMPMNQNGGTYFTVCTLNKNQENVKQLLHWRQKTMVKTRKSKIQAISTKFYIIRF